MLEIPKVIQESKVTCGSKELFLKAVSVWINKPHVANRRLCGSTIHYVCRCQTKAEAEKALVEAKKLFHDDWESGQSFQELSEEKSLYSIIFRELVPKSQFFPRLYETIVYDKDQATVTFHPVNDSSAEVEKGVLPTKEHTYTISFNETDDEMPGWAQVNEITIAAWGCESSETESTRCQMRPQWLRSVLLEKLVSWSQVNDITTSATSLTLVAVDKYKDTYVRLKNTYGRDLVKNWPERTDPKKFVYEDVAIAAYLLLIWEEDREKKGLTQKQSFVDLGCGNGLLVYILTKEGHKGLGIDLRKRKIWDMFAEEADLREQAIKPSSEHLFPDYDWLIGNHSDELTPWIPVIAARSSPTCSFFVLPCCHHDFVGKFRDSKKGQSRYGMYVDYVKEIVEHCGFLPEIDTLRIPSTKRISIIGRTRSYKPEDEAQAEARRQAFIEKRTHFSQAKVQQQTETNSSKLNQVSTDIPKVEVPSHENVEDLLCRSEKINPYYERSDSLGSLDSGLGSPRSDSCEVSHPPHCPSSSPVKQSQNSTVSTKRSEPSGLTSGHSDSAYTDITLHERKRLKLQDLSDRNEKSSSSKSNISTVTAHPAEQNWASGFQPRVESGMRNCQAVPEEIKLQIVKSVFDLVLKSNTEDKTVKNTEGKQWRKGGSVALSEVAKLFDQSTLRQLKAECGGLQTLLRNHSHIFQVSGGQVMLRDFSQADPWKGSNPNKRQASKPRAGQRDTWKTTPCWFFEHHPDGCPRSNSDCTFAHGQAELRAKPLVKGIA